MKKIFGRKSKDEEVSSDSSLGRNNRTSPNDNPYAQGVDSYANNSSMNSQSSYQQPPSSQSSFRSVPSVQSSGGRPGLPSGPRLGGPAARQPPSLPSYDSDIPPQYSSGSKSGSGYGDEKLGSSSGYGANRYNASSAAYNSQYNATSGAGNSYSSQRPGGYGGFDQSPSDSQSSAPPPQYSASMPGGGWSADAYGDRSNMTEEELEDAQVQDIKRETKEVRQQSQQSLARSLRTAKQAVGTARSTTGMLAHQQEMVDNIERGADAAIDRAKKGSEGTSKLDRLNSTPFFIPVAGEKKRLEEQEMQVRREREQKDAKEETRRRAYERDKKIQASLGRVEKPKLLGAGAGEKFTFEDEDGSQDEAENLIRDDLDELSEVVGELNLHARGFQAYLDADPNQLDRIAEKMSIADDKVTRAKAKLDGIH